MSEVIEVLLVAANPAAVACLSKAIEEAGPRFAVTYAGTLDDALARLSTHRGDVVLLDWELPGTAGSTAVQAIRRAADASLVAFSADESEAAGAETIAAGAHEFLARRQIDSRLLLRTIHQAIHRQQAERSQRERDRRRTERLAGIVHDLRNGLAVISGTARLLERSQSLEQLSESCRKIQGQVDQMVQAIRNLSEIARQADPAAEILERRAAAPNGQTYRILLIEDHPLVARLTREELQGLGHEVAVAVDGESGLELAREFRPQTVLCDIRLKGAMNGYEVAQAIRADESLRSLFLVATTGHSDEEDRRRALEAGFDLHMSKPIDFAELAAALGEAGEAQGSRG